MVIMLISWGTFIVMGGVGEGGGGGVWKSAPNQGNVNNVNCAG